MSLLLFLALVQGPADPGFRVQQALLPSGDLRNKLTLEYVRQHYDPAATEATVLPTMIVVHWTASATLKALLATFRPEELPRGRPELLAGGRLNVSSHYVIDRDGTIYQLLPDQWMARHTIGLNRVALGIENVGGPQWPLTAAQIASCTWLVKDLVRKHPTIRYLIGHYEYLRFKGTPLWQERDPRYLTRKQDPGLEFMARLRQNLRGLGLSDSYKGVPSAPARDAPLRGRQRP
jgi:N-acetylmuramoyl-L-alanine amidase